MCKHESMHMFFMGLIYLCLRGGCCASFIKANISCFHQWFQGSGVGAVKASLFIDTHLTEYSDILGNTVICCLAESLKRKLIPLLCFSAMELQQAGDELSLA